MTALAWVLIALAAIAAGAAVPFRRRSRVALAIVVTGAAVAVCGVLFSLLGFGGCSDRGDCGAVGGTMRVVIVLGLLALPVLFACAGLAWIWGRVMPRDRRRRPLRRRDALLGLMGAGCVALGLATLVLAPDRRLTGLVIALFGAACATVPLSSALARRTGGAPYLDQLEQNGVLVPALVIRASPVKLRLLRAGMACFAGASLVMLLAPEALAGEGTDTGEVVVAGWIGTITFGVVGVISLFTARTGQRIALLPSGLRWELGMRPEFAAWDDIDGVHTFAIRGTEFVGIDVRGGTGRRTLGRRALGAANQALAGSDASFGVEAFLVDADRLAEVIESCCASPTRRREIGTEKSLAWLAPTT